MGKDKGEEVDGKGLSVERSKEPIVPVEYLARIGTHELRPKAQPPANPASVEISLRSVFGNNGCIVEEWMLFNEFEVMQQIYNE